MLSVEKEHLNCKDCVMKSDAAMKLSSKELDYLASGCTDVRFNDGDKIISEGLPNSHIVYLREGFVKIHMVGPSGRDQILKIAQPRSYIGIETILGHTINKYSASALSTARVCYINGNVFTDLINKNVGFTASILTWICRENLKYYRRYVDLQQKRIAGRLADALKMFSEEIYKSKKFILPFSYVDLAALIGTTRESVTRIIREFTISGLIEVNDREVTISNYDMLKKISENG